MRKLRIALLFVLVLVMTACSGHRFDDIRFTSVRLVSLSPEGFSSVSAVVEVGIDNPTVAFNVENIEGVARFQGQEALHMTGEKLSVAAHSEGLYQLPLQGSMAEGFNPLRLLRLLGDEASFDDISFDLRARVALRSGIGKNIEVLDIPLSELLGGTVIENHENTMQ
jgi:hypothetical protein